MDFSIEIDTLDSAISTYDEALKSLKDNLNLLNRSLKDIDNSGWKGKSKEQFMSIKYGNWEQGIKEHISRLEFLVGMLKEAKGEFESLEQQGNSL